MTILKKERVQMLKYLTSLIQNNNREWFQEHKEDYNLMRTNLEQLVIMLGEGLAQIKPSFKFTKSGDYTFRIYRDVRFSKDKSPYKNHIGIYLINGGRKSPMAGYYVHIQPGESFVAGGLFRPDSKILRAVRDEIYYNHKDFGEIVLHKEFQSFFGKLWDEDKLKRVPRDFPKDSPAGEWLKFKSYIAMRSLTDADFLGDKFIETTLDTFRKIKPMNNFLNNAIALSQEDNYDK